MNTWSTLRDDDVISHDILQMSRCQEVRLRSVSLPTSQLEYNTVNFFHLSSFWKEGCVHNDCWGCGGVPSSTPLHNLDVVSSQMKLKDKKPLRTQKVCVILWVHLWWGTRWGRVSSWLVMNRGMLFPLTFACLCSGVGGWGGGSGWIEGYRVWGNGQCNFQMPRQKHQCERKGSAQAWHLAQSLFIAFGTVEDG